MDTNIQLPSGDGGDATIELQMDPVHRALARIEEIAIVNAHKAPELCSCFARAFATVTDHMSRVTSEIVKAKNRLSNRVAVVTLDEAPRILREKGLISARSPGGSEDLRKSVLEVDPEYIVCRNRLQELEAYEELLKGKQECSEQGYLACRKLMGDSIGFQGRSQRLGSSMPEQQPFEGSELERVLKERAVVKLDYPAPKSDLRGQFGTAKD